MIIISYYQSKYATFLLSNCRPTAIISSTYCISFSSFRCKLRFIFMRMFAIIRCAQIFKISFTPFSFYIKISISSILIQEFFALPKTFKIFINLNFSYIINNIIINLIANNFLNLFLIIRILYTIQILSFFYN